MNKKALGMFLLGTSLLFCSCVDDTYDLKKEIDTDVEIKGNKLAFPLGTLRPFMLDSLVCDMDIVETMEDGVYCIKKKDIVEAEKHIEPIVIDIPSRTITKEIGVSGLLAMGNTMTRMALPPLPFSIDEKFSFENKVSNQFKCFYACTFENKMPIRLYIKMEGLDALQATSANLNFGIEFPAFLDGLTSNDAKIVGNHVEVNKEYLAKDDKGMVIELYCSGINFEKALGVEGLKPQKDANGDPYLELSC
jgi:hypothetical protein